MSLLPPTAQNMKGQAALEFIVYLAVLLGIVALFLPAISALSDYSRDFASYSGAQSETVSAAYFLSSSYLSGALYASPAGFDVRGGTLDYAGNSSMGKLRASTAAPFTFGTGAFSLVDYNVE
ncbi:MAG: hypothetical protein WC506_02525 [Candidatus Micrarchaeia archaeon]